MCLKSNTSEIQMTVSRFFSSPTHFEGPGDDARVLGKRELCSPPPLKKYWSNIFLCGYGYVRPASVSFLDSGSVV